MYREMSAEEKLQFSSEVIESLKKDGFIACLEVVEKYKEKINENDIKINETQNINNYKQENSYDFEVNNDYEQIQNDIITEEPKAASIYAEKHLSAVQKDLEENKASTTYERIEHTEEVTSMPIIPPEKPKGTEVVKRVNPWGDAQTVLPGEVKQKLAK